MYKPETDSRLQHIMSTLSLWRLVAAWFTSSNPSLSVDEQYLSHAVDLCDLERRQHDIDERGRNPESAICLGLYAC